MINYQLRKTLFALAVAAIMSSIGAGLAASGTAHGWLLLWFGLGLCLGATWVLFKQITTPKPIPRQILVHSSKPGRRS